MKKLLALVALVAMVAVGSIAYAAAPAVTISGTVDSAISIDPCAITFPLSLSTTVQHTPCGSAPTQYSSNATAGYTVTLGATNSYLNSGTDTIPALTEGASTTCAADALPTASCFSYTWDTDDDATGTYLASNGTNVNVGEHAYPTAATLFTSAVNQTVTDATYVLTAHAGVKTTQPAGTYTLAGGTIDIASR